MRYTKNLFKDPRLFLHITNHFPDGSFLSADDLLFSYNSRTFVVSGQMLDMKTGNIINRSYEFEFIDNH